MAKDAVIQVRIDADIKEQVERLYISMGSSFAEAIRMMAAQSLIEQGMPFRPTMRPMRGELLSYNKLDRALFDAEIESGFAQADAGRVLSSEQVMSETRARYSI